MSSFLGPLSEAFDTAKPCLDNKFNLLSEIHSCNSAQLFGLDLMKKWEASFILFLPCPPRTDIIAGRWTAMVMLRGVLDIKTGCLCFWLSPT